jgi:hypothetical protein
MIYYLLISLFGFVIFLLSIHKSKNNQFYSDTFLLAPFGVYVWGDGIILGLFWILIGLFAYITNLEILWFYRFYLLFWAIRSGYEVVYWLNHQSVKSEYQPPILRNFKWLKTNETQILYQVANSCLMTIAFGLLGYSFK